MAPAEYEKDRWWLVGVSIAWQQAILVSTLFTPVLDARSRLMAHVPELVIWIMWFALPFVYLHPTSVKVLLRNSAKVGWLYVLAAITIAICDMLSVAIPTMGLRGRW